MKPDVDVPEGGCTKYSEASITQVFDADGKCVHQQIDAGESNYEDAEGVALDSDDSRLSFYHPFNMEPLAE